MRGAHATVLGKAVIRTYGTCAYTAESGSRLQTHIRPYRSCTFMSIQELTGCTARQGANRRWTWVNTQPDRAKRMQCYPNHDNVLVVLDAHAVPVDDDGQALDERDPLNQTAQVLRAHVRQQHWTAWARLLHEQRLYARMRTSCTIKAGDAPRDESDESCDDERPSSDGSA